MIDLKEIKSEIAKLEAGSTCYQNCERLAWLYIVLDHMENDSSGVKSISAEWSDHDERPFGREIASAWMEKIENDDGTKGPHWSFDQVRQVIDQRGISENPDAFWVAMNAMYSDYCKVAKKYGVGSNIDYWVDMAKAFIGDKDAKEDKLSRYYKYVVKH